ncbi:MAG TPA: CoA-transferase [Syntrophales bacterium]|nr:CoA-transferase [Syntrophales bacterium]
MGKVVSLRDAVSSIRDGDVLFLGSLIECRRPMAAAYEIVRQGKKGLVLLAECSLAEDILVGAGCAAGWRGCYTGMANFGLSPATLRKIETGGFVVDDIGHIDIILGAMAAMAGSPFVATRATLGSDVLNPEFSRTEAIRNIVRDPSMIPAKKFVLMDDPFYGSGPVKLQPAMPADVAVIHVQQAGEEGTGRIEGSLAFDHYFVHAAKKVILTAEQIVPESYLRRDPNRNQIPCTSVDMVVEVPWGGHPSQVQGFYDCDMLFIHEYVKAAKTEDGFNEWIDEWVVKAESHDAYVESIGAARLQYLRAIPPYGYRPRNN